MGTVLAISLLMSHPPAPCTALGELPDPVCTPGMASVHDARLVCSQPTRERRKVSTATKRRIFAAHALRWPGERSAFEVDHLIPLALGGSVNRKFKLRFAARSLKTASLGPPEQGGTWSYPVIW